MEFNLLIIGIVCFGIEAILPGFGVFGLLGIISLLGALFFVLGANSFAAMIVAILAVVIIILGCLFINYFPDSSLGRILSLKWRSTTDKGYVSVDVKPDLVGKEGIAKTVLRPAGTIEIEDKLFDAVTEGSFIEPGTNIMVISVSGGRILVRAKKK